MPGSWFELSQEGWRGHNRARPLGALVCEGVQNALDHGAARIDVRLSGEEIRIDDDGDGIADPALVYTVFLSDKGAHSQKRGRYGRGLKDLISLARQAEVLTVGFGVRFAPEGRELLAQGRRRGTRVRLTVDQAPDDVRQAEAFLSRVIVPAGVRLKVNGKTVRRPRPFASLRDLALPTVLFHEDGPEVTVRPADVGLFRAEVGQAWLYEMGMPVSPLPTPWHADVGQRVLRQGAGGGAEPDYQDTLLLALFENLIAAGLSPEDLRSSWVRQMLAHPRASDAALRHFAHAALPARAVLSAGPAADDEARRLGAELLDTLAYTDGERAALARVLPSSAQFVARRKTAVREARATAPFEQRAVAFYSLLGRKVLGRAVKVRLVRMDRGEGGVVHNALFDRKTYTLLINTEGRVDLRVPLAPENLAVVLHELAHAETAAHDQAFIGSLENVAGRAAALLLRQGRQMVEQAGLFLDEEPPER